MRYPYNRMLDITRARKYLIRIVLCLIITLLFLNIGKQYDSSMKIAELRTDMNSHSTSDMEVSSYIRNINDVNFFNIETIDVLGKSFLNSMQNECSVKQLRRDTLYILPYLWGDNISAVFLKYYLIFFVLVGFIEFAYEIIILYMQQNDGKKDTYIIQYH